MTETQGSTQTRTALQFDLADAKRQHEWLLERYGVVLDQRNELLEALRDVRRLLENDILPRMAAPVDPLGIAHGRVQEAITTIQAAIEKAEVRR